MARPFSDEEGAKLVPEIKEKAAERDAELTLPVDFASSSNFCEDNQIKESDPSTGVPEGNGVPEGFISYTDKASVSTMLDPTFMKVVDRYNNVWGYSCCVMILNKHMAREDAKARGEALAALKRIRARAK